jgi:hypothetical protein
MELSGHRVNDESLKTAGESSLRRLFHSMLDLVERGHSVHMYPDFNPSLSWHLDDEGVLCTLLPRDEQTISEVDQVRLVARAFYRLATGIEPERLRGSVPALLRWWP